MALDRRARDRASSRGRRPARPLSGGGARRAARRRPVPRPGAARRRGGVPAPPALPRDLRPRSSRLRTGPARRELPASRRCSRSRSRSVAALAAVSFLWTWDERAGSIALAFFFFPFAAGLARRRAVPLADWLPRALAHARRARDAVRGDRALAGPDADALLRAATSRSRTRTRRSSASRRCSRIRASTAAISSSRSPCSSSRSSPSRPDDRLARRDRVRRVPLRRPLLLLLAVELRRALRRHVRGRGRARRPPPRGSCSPCARAIAARRAGPSSRRARSADARRRTSRAAARGSSRSRSTRSARARSYGVGIGGQPQASLEESRERAPPSGTRRTRRR